MCVVGFQITDNWTVSSTTSTTVWQLRKHEMSALLSEGKSSDHRSPIHGENVSMPTAAEYHDGDDNDDDYDDALLRAAIHWRIYCLVAFANSRFFSKTDTCFI